MVDLSKMSNEELLGLEKQTSQVDLSTLSDNELLAMESNTTSSKFRSHENLKSEVSKVASGVNLWERAILTFSDDAGAEKFLKKRYRFVTRDEKNGLMVGNSVDNMRQVDPSGFFNDAFGEVVDKIDDVIRIGGQIFGAVTGSPAGPAGVIAGGALGSAGAEATISTIGHKLGVRESSFDEEVVNVAISGAFGAFGEGAGLVIGKALTASKPLAMKAIGNITDNLINAADKSGKRELMQSFLGHSMSFASAVNKDAAIHLVKNGSREVFTPLNVNPLHAPELGRKIAKEIIEAKASAGREVGNAFDDLARVKHLKGTPVDISPPFQSMTDELARQGLVTIDASGNIIVNKFLASEGRKTMNVAENILGQLGAVGTAKDGTKRFVLPNFGGKIGQKNIANKTGKFISVRQSKILITQFGDEIDKLSPNGQRAILNFLSGTTDEIASGASGSGLRGQVTRLAEGAGVQGERYLKANANMTAFHKAISQAQANGYNLLDGNSVGQLSTNYLAANAGLREAIGKIDPLTISGSHRELMNFATAQAFASSNANLMRLSLLAGFMGLGFGGNEPMDRLPTLGAALLIGSPVGNRTLFQAGGKLAHIMLKPFSATAKLSKNLKPLIKPLSNKRLLTALLSQGANQQNQ